MLPGQNNVAVSAPASVLAMGAVLPSPPVVVPDPSQQTLIDHSRYHPVVREYYCRIIDNGGNIYQDALGALSHFVHRLIRTALWAKVTEIYPFCGQGIESAEVKLKYLDTPLLSNHSFNDEDFEEWGITGGIQPDGATKYFDTGFSADNLSDTPHLCYIEHTRTGAGGASPVTALGVTDGTLEWSLGAQVEVDDRTGILGSNTIMAQTPSAYADWTSFYIVNREDADLLRLFKRTHLKATTTTPATVSPKPALNLFIGARNNNGVADQFFRNRIRFASIGEAMTAAETVEYYCLVQQLMQRLERTV